MTTFVLVLLASVYGGDTVTVVPGYYKTREACEAAGAEYRTMKSGWLTALNFRCITGPEGGL